MRDVLGPVEFAEPVTAPLYPVRTASCTTGQSGLTFNASGQATAAITLYDVQSTTLRVTSNNAVAGKTGTSGTFAVSSGSVKTLTIPTTPTTQTAGAAFNVTVDATDNYGNPYSRATGVRHLQRPGELARTREHSADLPRLRSPSPTALARPTSPSLTPRTRH